MSKLISYAQWCEVFNKIESWEIGHTDSDIINAIDMELLTGYQELQNDLQIRFLL